MSELLKEAVLAQAGCDWATSWDRMGFNKYNAKFGHELARLAEVEQGWTPAQARTARKMIRKYKEQLSRYGIDADETDGLFLISFIGAEGRGQ